MGHNSSNVGLVSILNGQLKMTVNFRYVNTCSKEQLIKTIKSSNKGMDVEILGDSPLLYFSQEDKLITTLLNALWTSKYKSFLNKSISFCAKSN